MDHHVYAETAAREREIHRIVDESYSRVGGSGNQWNIAHLEQRLAKAENHIDYLVGILEAVILGLYEEERIPTKLKEALDAYGPDSD